MLQATSEPKSADVRRVSQKVVTSLFDLNPATFSLMLRSVAKPLQEAANKILKVYMQVSIARREGEREEGGREGIKDYIVSGCTHRKYLAQMKRWPHPLAPPLLLASGQPVGQEGRKELMSPPHPPQRYTHLSHAPICIEQSADDRMPYIIGCICKVCVYLK